MTGVPEPAIVAVDAGAAAAALGLG
jgi:hypothetical protein